MTTTLRGKCMCGVCSFRATPVSNAAGVCHCEMCRKWSGGMFLNVDCGTSVAFDDGASIGSYKGSEWGERLFCTVCGSTLMWQMQDGTHQSMSIQAFDDPSQFVLKSQIFIDRKPDGYTLADQTENMTEAECFAKYAPEGA